jgi:hypothetical protein
VVQVLPTTGGIGAQGLDMAELVGADPDALPCRRDHEAPDVLQELRVVDPGAGLIEILETSSAPAAGDPGSRAVDASKARHVRLFPPRPTLQSH